MTNSPLFYFAIMVSAILCAIFPFSTKYQKSLRTVYAIIALGAAYFAGVATP